MDGSRLGSLLTWSLPSQSPTHRAQWGLWWTGLLGGTLVLLGGFRLLYQAVVLGSSTSLSIDLVLRWGVPLVACGGSVLLAVQRRSLQVARAYASGAVLGIVAALLYSEALKGRLNVAGLLLLYYLGGTAAIPLPRRHRLLLGSSLGGLLAGAGGLTWLPVSLSIPPGPLVEHLLLLAVATTLTTVLLPTPALSSPLPQRTQWLTTVMQNLSDGIFRTRPGEGLIYANAAFANMLGYPSSKEIQQQSLRSFFAAPEQHAALMDQLRRGESINQREIQFQRRDGSTFIGLLSCTAAHTAGNEILYCDGVLTDITTRKEKERELERERDRFATLFHHLPNPAAYGKTDGDQPLVTAVNQAFQTVFGIDEAQIQDDDLHEWIFSPSPDWSRTDLQRHLDPDEDLQTEVRRSTKTGLRDFQVQVTFRRTSKETTEGYAIYTDITDRKRRERELRNRRDKIEALYAATGNLLQERDRAAVAAQIEDLVVNTLDYPLNTVRFVEDGRLYPAHNSPSISDHMPERPVYDIESDYPAAQVYRDGKSRMLGDLQVDAPAVDRGQARATAYVPIEGHGVISVASLEPDAIDPFDVRLLEILAGNVAVILDRSQRERELIDAKEEAEEANRLKSAFLANMSHEIRTPLTSIIGFAEVLGDALADDATADAHTEDPSHFAHLIEKSGRRLLNTLNSVLDLSQLEAGSMEVTPEPIDVRPIVADAVAMTRPEAKAHDRTVTIDLPEEAPLMTRADEGAVQRILDNLLGNATKFTEPGDTISVRAYQTESDTVITVADTGVGIDAAFRSDLFDAFKQGSSGTARSHEGTGLGLAVTKRLVDHLDGTIDVDSERGVGTTFHVRLPRAHARK